MVRDRDVCERWCVTNDGWKMVCDKWWVTMAGEVGEAAAAGYRIKNKNPTQRCGEKPSFIVSVLKSSHYVPLYAISLAL